MRVNDVATEDAKSKILSLLNHRKPQFPPDVYYIRRNPQVLTKFLNDSNEISALKRDQSPQQRLSYQMFQLTDADKDILKKKEEPRMVVSEKDPFMNKPKKQWQSFHKPIASTSEIMESLEPYETRRVTEGSFMDRFTDQEKRYYRNEEEEAQRKANMHVKKQRQMETMGNPEEALKIHRLRKELSASRHLTEVNDDFHLFELATNKHFNQQMNKMQQLGEMSASELDQSSNKANQVLDKIKAAMQGNEVSSQSVNEHRYDRMSRKDFSRKANSFAPVLINDSYANFRFSKRANEVLSPLSKNKFGFNTQQSATLRKMSQLNPNTRGNLSMRISGQGHNQSFMQEIEKPNRTSYARLGQKQHRNQSIASESVHQQYKQAGFNTSQGVFNPQKRRTSQPPRQEAMVKNVAELTNSFS